MAKLTLSGLQTIVSAVIDDTKIAVDSPFVPTYNSITGLVNKIGKQLMLDSNFEDRLPELEGEMLPWGGTIEEYFTNLILPVAFDPDGATALAPKRPTFEDVVYSYPLLKKTFATTIDDGKMENHLLGQEEFSALIAQITKALYDSLAIYKYGLKKQLMGDAIALLPVAGPLVKTVVALAKPVDTATAEAFAKSVKNKFEYMTNLHDDITINGTVVARSNPEDLVLYVTEGITSVLDVDLEGGAFNVGKVQIPVRVKALENFGVIPGAKHLTAYALLVDTRGLRIHTKRQSATSQYNGEGEFTNFFLHYEPVGYISKYTNICVWEPA